MAITDPTDITGLVFWGDAEAANITENPAGKAEIMDNQEGTATEDLNQSVSVERPSIVTVFGKAGLQFDPDDDQHLDGGGAGALIGAGTLVMVLRLPSTAIVAGTILLGNVSNVVSAIRLRKAVGEIEAGRNASGPAVSITPDVDWAFGDDVVLTLIWDGSDESMIIRINGIEKDSGIGSAFAGMDGISIGAEPVPVLGSDINVYGLVTYDSILTGIDLTDIESFMTTTYLPVDVLTANAGPNQTVTADESQNILVTLDGNASSGPLPIINFEWKEGATVLSTGDNPFAFVSLAAGVHTITLTVTDSNNDTDTDTVVITVNAFVPAVIRTFKEITGSTDTVHTFNEVFPLTDRLTLLPFTEHFNQVRVFKKDATDLVTELFPVGRPSPAETTDFTINEAGTSITLDVALITSDTLLIMRETAMSKPFVTFIGPSRLRGKDRNTQGDQILFVVQELRETRIIADILGSDIGEPFEYATVPFDKSNWSKDFIGDGSTTSFSYSDIEMFPATTVRHEGQLLVFFDGVLQTSGFTVDASARTVDFSVAPTIDVAVTIRRITRIDIRWVTFHDASTFSSLQNTWNFLNIKFIIEETPEFPAFLLSNALSNRIFPRALNILNFSGPGDRFFFGNLAFFGDGTVFVFKNDLRLIEGVDYTIDFNLFFINFTIPLVSADTLQINSTTPNNAFGSLNFGSGSIAEGGIENPPEEDPAGGGPFIGKFDSRGPRPLTYAFGQGAIQENTPASCVIPAILHSVPRGTSPASLFRNVLQTALLSFDISSLVEPVTEAHLLIDNSRFFSTVGNPHPVLHIRRVPKETVIPESIVCVSPSVTSWLEKNTVTMDAWSGNNTDVDGNGSRSPLDNDAATEVTVPWPGLGSGAILLHSVNISGLGPMVEAARLNGEGTLLIVFYYLGAADVATEVFDRRTEWQFNVPPSLGSPSGGRVQLFVTPSP